MSKNESDIQWLDSNISTYIIKSLIIAHKIIELVKVHNECNECGLLDKISDIIKRLGETTVKNNICLFPIKDMILLPFDKMCYNVAVVDVCKEVWGLLKEIFEQPSKAEEISKRMENIYKQLYIQFEKERDE